MRKLIIVAGMFVCAFKGLVWAIGGVPSEKIPDHPERAWSTWGFNDPDLDIIWAWQKTRPDGSRAHHATDLIVEWNQLDPQRGAKLLLSLAVLTFAIGVGLGWLL